MLSNVLILSFLLSTSYSYAYTIPSKQIRSIFCDMDGTLLRSTHTLSSRSIGVIKKIIESGILFFPATGRTKISMVRAVGATFTDIFGGVDRIAGVYQQGLMVYNFDGKLIYERFLDSDVISAVELFCETSRENPGLVGYNDCNIYSRKLSVHTECLSDYKDTAPDIISSGLRSLAGSGICVHKLILMHEPEVLIQLRPALQSLLHGKATLTQAVPNMLEVLPFGASKGAGVGKLLEHYGILSEEALAFGDGENDVEMFQLVGTSAAVANANPKLKEVADFVIPSNNEDGVAATLERLISELSLHQLSQ